MYTYIRQCYGIVMGMSGHWYSRGLVGTPVALMLWASATRGRASRQLVEHQRHQLLEATLEMRRKVMVRDIYDIAWI